MKTLIFALFLGVTISPTQAAVTVLDSFTEGPFALSIEGIESSSAPISSPFGETRRGRINSRQAMAGGTVTSTLDESLGTLDFNVDALPIGSGAIDLRLTYSEGGPYNLLGFSALEFEFGALTGSGFLIVELGSATDVYGPATNRIALNGPGVISVPFSELNFGTNGSIDSFSSMHFTFEATTEQFSMTLNEIRVVPEPSVVALTMPFLLTILLNRRRN